MFYRATLLLALATSLSTAETTKSTFSPDQLNELRLLIKEEIKNDPESIVKSIQRYSEEQQLVALKKDAERVSKFTKELTDDSTAIISGNPNGEVKLVVFADPNCVFCRQLEKQLTDFKKQFNNLKVYMRPVAIRPESTEVIQGMVALSGKDPKKYENLAISIASNEEGIDKDKFIQLANQAKFDESLLKDSSLMEKAKKIIDTNRELAERKIGIHATPSIYLINKDGLEVIMPGNPEELKKKLENSKA